MERMKTIILLVGIMVTNINLNIKPTTMNNIEPKKEMEQNRTVVNNFFLALETQNFEMLKEVFAKDGKQLNPYAPEGFPEIFEGVDAIYKQYSGLTETFGKMKFPRTIYATENPDFFFVKFKGEIEIKAGGIYKNDYLGTFLLKNGKVIEYTEYFNQLIMAKAFGIKLK